MAWRVPFLDLRVSDERECEALLSVIAAVLRHGRFVLGPEVAEFERQVAGLCGRRYAVGVGSGTDALFLALKSLNVGCGDEVITTSLSWIATANAIALTGATPVFADIREDLNIDPDSVRRLVTPRTKAVIPVHYTGKMCEMDALMAVVERSGAALVEDAAQAFGATLDGRPAGAFGKLACFSMNPMKVLAACGEAGLILTDCDGLYERLLALRYNGTVNKETCIEPSLNGRLDTLQAAVLLHRLPLVQGVIERRRRIAARYNTLLGDVVRTPTERAGQRDAYYTYTIRSRQRDALKGYLESCGIETKIQHPILMPDQPPYRATRQSDCVNARSLVQEILCLPASETLAEADIELVAGCIRTFYGRGDACRSSSAAEK